MILADMGVPNHLISLIKNLYINNTAVVKIENQTSQEFHTEKGVRQGCILSPILFNIYAEYIMKKVFSAYNRGIRIAGLNLNNLRYADDTTILANSLVNLESIFKLIEDESVKLGLHINRSKTKIMIVNKFSDDDFDNSILKDLEIVDSYNYLGSIVNNSGNSSEEIRRRILLGKTAMTNLQIIWKDPDITRNTKMKLVKTLVFSVVLYASDMDSIS